MMEQRAYENLTVKKSLPESEGSMPCSQEPITEPYEYFEQLNSSSHYTYIVLPVLILKKTLKFFPRGTFMRFM
jgi:hypothetical protein